MGMTLLFLLIVLADLGFGILFGNLVSQAYFVNSPTGGYRNGLPLSFSVEPSNTANPDVQMFMFINTTSQSGLSLVAQQPITVVAQFIKFGNITERWYDTATNVEVIFPDAEPVSNGQMQIQLPTGASIPIANGSAGWGGRRTIWFPFQGNFAPQLAFDNQGQHFILSQVGTSQFVLPISPLNTIATNYNNQANISLSGALLFFAVIESLFVIRKIYPSTVFGTDREIEEDTEP